MTRVSKCCDSFDETRKTPDVDKILARALVIARVFAHVASILRDFS